MSTIHLRTIVYDTPRRGPLLGRAQWIVHWCIECHTNVPTVHLVAHARAHGDPTPREVRNEGAAID
jgi:hypothetical protein